jgi:hypothetical protein
VTLTAFSEELTRASGVAHRALKPHADSQRLVLFCKDQPAESVRAAVTHLLGWDWTREARDGATRHTLVKGVAQLKLEEALRARAWTQYGEIIRVLAAEAGDPDARGGGALRSQARLPVCAALLGVAAALGPEGVDRLSRGTVVSSRVSALSPALATAFQKLVGQGQTEPHPSDTVRLGLAKTAAGAPDSLELSVWRDGKLLLQFNAGHASLARVDAKRDGESGRVRIMPLLGRHPELRAPLPKLPPLEWPPGRPPSKIGWTLRDLARRIPVPIIADCYPAMEAAEAAAAKAGGQAYSRPPWPSPPHDGKTLLHVLEMITASPSYSWRYEQGWLLFRYDEWFWEPLRRPSSRVRGGATGLSG